MLFNSIEFAIFLPIVFIFYWFVFNKNLKLQNLFVLTASYVFYGWWDWRFLFLIILSSVIDFFVGIHLSKSRDPKKRKLFLITSIFANLGILGFFKYYNFFIDNLTASFTFFGQNINPARLDIILPVGISFYTFQSLSYSIDIYRKKLEATRDFIAFSAFVSFFPQLVAGPIERAVNLLPQFYRERSFEYHKAVDGLRQILWGLFKKIVIADNCARYANLVFNNSRNYSGSALVLGTVFFAFQIYADFSGYSDIAIGSARLFGFDLMQNFAFPYFSRDIAEFWRRWHISLSSWFRDYVYIPLGGSRTSTFKMARNTFIIFILSGFWHGANWTFVVWGILNALYFLPLQFAGKNRKHLDTVSQNGHFPGLFDILRIVRTFVLTLFAWIFFRAESIGAAIHYIQGIFTRSLFTIPALRPWDVIMLICFFTIIEWLGRQERYALEKFMITYKRPFRWGFYIFICILIFLFHGTKQDFIYFQF